MDKNMKPSIAGLIMTPLKQIADERGAVLHLLRSDDANFKGFGECYCSETLPGAVKAWKRHKVQTQNLAVPSGQLRLVVFDDREGSPSKGKLEVVDLGRPDNYVRVSIPPGLWYGFSTRGEVPALIVNCADQPHDPDESERLPENDPHIPYRWRDHKRGGL
jgi:dTDP-4-dehydrorhamnose 3,5-epimerase